MSGTRYTAVEMIERLVAFPTVSRDSNLELIGFVSDYLDGWGVPWTLFEDPVMRKANLLATVGPADVPGVILSGHTDVVPVDGQDWSADPFAPWMADGRLYGRGTSDMKGFIGAVLAQVPDMIQANMTAPVHIALSYDEEVGCTGVLSLIAHVAARDPRPRLCIVGEPTSMRVVNAHKGIRAFRTRIRGLAGHSSAPAAGANAVLAAAELMGYIARLAEELAGEAVDPRFEPPHTTMNVGLVTGGTAVNVIPAEASFEWEYRPLPQEDPDAVFDKVRAHAETVVLPKLQATAGQAASITFETLAKAPSLAATADNEAERFVRRLTGANSADAVAYATEAGLFQGEAGVPTVVCGPGSIDQAHKPDEFIALTEIDRAEAFLARLRAELSAG